MTQMIGNDHEGKVRIRSRKKVFVRIMAFQDYSNMTGL